MMSLRPRRSREFAIQQNLFSIPAASALEEIIFQAVTNIRKRLLNNESERWLLIALRLCDSERYRKKFLLISIHF